MHYVIGSAPCTNLADLGTGTAQRVGEKLPRHLSAAAPSSGARLLRPSLCHPRCESSTKNPSMIPFSAEIPQPPVVRGSALSDSVRFRLYASSAARARQLTTHLSSTQISPDDQNDDDRVKKNGVAPGTQSRSRSTLGKQVIPPPNGLVALSTHTPTLQVSALVAASDHNLPQPPAVQY